MKKIILMLLVSVTSLIVNAQDTITSNNPQTNKVITTKNMFGVELGIPIQGRGLINTNATIPQRIS